MNEHDVEHDPAFRDARAVLEGLARATRPATKQAETSRDPSKRPSLDGHVARTSSVAQSWKEETLRALLAALPDALVVINQQGAIVLVNEQTERLFGYQRDELLGRPVEILVPARWQHSHMAQRNAFLAAPRHRAMGEGRELFGLAKDGREFPVEISLSPLRTEKETLVTAVIRDVSRRKRDEAKFRTMVETIPAVTFIAPLDDSAPEFYVSPQIEQLLGFSQKEWLEDPVLWHRQLHPDDRERWNHQFAPTCATGEPFRSVYRFIAKNGRVVWVHGSAQLVRGADGQAIFLQGIAFDVTAIKEAEENERERAGLLALQAAIGGEVTRAESLADMLRGCAQALSRHVDIVTACVWTLSDKGDALELQAQVNSGSVPDLPERRVALGQPTVGLIAVERKPLWTDAVAGEQRVKEQDWARGAGLTSFVGLPLQIEGRLMGVLTLFSRRRFSPRVVQVLELVGGEIALGIERKGAEETLYKLNAELEQRVQARTEELARSMAELREKSGELEQFSYQASHDLKEPLRTLENRAQLLQKEYQGRFDEQADIWIGRIMNGAKRMRQLLVDLSDYASVLRRDRAFEPVDVSAIVTDAVSCLQAAIEESGADIRIEPLPTLRGNRPLLMLLFQNLIGNALKFRPPDGKPHIEVGCRPQGDGWLFWVRDNGIGIEERFLRRVFNLGERLNKKHYPGSGYGLTICEKIVTRHGGTIWVESELGAGSTFYLTFPEA